MEDELVVVMRTIVEALVDRPEAVVVQGSRGDHDALSLYVRVAPEDVGKLIGKKGRTARALRTIAWALASKRRTTCELDIFEYNEAA